MASANTASAGGRFVRVVAAVTFASTTILMVVGAVFTALAREPLWPNSLASVAVYPFALVGVLIAFRRPQNRIAWLCLIIGLGFALEGALWGVALYGLSGPGEVPQPELLAAVGDAFVMPSLFLMTTLLLLLFPDGHLPSPRWRWLAWAASIAIPGMFVLALLAPVTSGWGRPAVENPIAVADHIYLEVLAIAVIVVLFGCVLGSIVALARRFRGSTGIVRLQLKWLAAAGGGATVVWLLAIVAEQPLLGEAGAVAVTVGAFAFIPVAIGVAVLRYRLFDIDRLVSRTVAYGLVVAVLVGVYTGGVLLLRSLFPAQSQLAVAASTLAVVALFVPVRRRVQERVDRRFNRARYDAERELERFGARLRDELDLDALTEDLLEIVGGTVQPSTASVWIRAGRSAGA